MIPLLVRPRDYMFSKSIQDKVNEKSAKTKRLLVTVKTTMLGS